MIRHRVRVATSALLTILALAGCTAGTGDSGYRFKTANKVGETIESARRATPGSFTGDLLDGGRYRSADDSGKVVLINFWAEWCPPCAVELPDLDHVYRSFANKAVDFVGIDTKDDRGRASGFVSTHHISFPTVYDERAEIALHLGNLPVQGLPFSVLLDKHGRVAAVYQGRLQPEDIAPVLDELLAET